MPHVLIKMLSAVFLGLLLVVHSAHSADKVVILKPFTLAKVYKNAKMPQVADVVKRQLEAGGFNIVGIYKPYAATNIFIITDNTILKSAEKSKFGGFGAAIRVSVTQSNNDVQVAHNNPTYMGIAYSMKTYLSSTRQKLAQTLGYVEDFGGKGIPSNELADYNYSVGLEGFSGFMDLAEHKSYSDAMKAVENGFSKNLKNMQKVYQIDIPGKNQTIFGVSLKNDVNNEKYLNDQYVMNILESKDLSRSAHLPYEIMVSDNRVLMMHPHFRLAINFPDLHMFGKNSFGQLMNLPYVYEEFFIQLAGGKWPRPEY